MIGAGVVGCAVARALAENHLTGERVSGREEARERWRQFVLSSSKL